ncbi:MAG: hypothetical protein Q9220_003199 [cf. Caloplaca sp. 1 TL-2023]
MATGVAPHPTYNPGILRSSSDSVVNSRETHLEDFITKNDLQFKPYDQKPPKDDVAVQTQAQGTLVVAARALSPSKTASPSNKVRQNLQLPSFHALGIAVPYPPTILTPPDEPAPLSWDSPLIDEASITPTQIRSHTDDVSATNTPQVSYPSGQVGIASNPTAAQDPAASLISPSIQSGDDQKTISSDSSTATEIASYAPWLEQALGAIVPLVASGSSASGVVSVLHHPQPCPLSRNVIGAPSALTGVINALQIRFEQFSATRYVDVTHAVPAKFSFSQLPSSPVTTPNRPAAEATMTDYFSTPRTVVYAKGAIAASHAETRQHLVENPSGMVFPQTVVAPSSIAISVLERFIPPATKQEYNDLFTSDQPSALMDRLTELKPDNGTLLFVYPTKQGALTFKEKYLRPILDPLLRTMIGVHGISPSVVEDVANFDVMYTMYRYDLLKAKLAQMIASMNAKGNGSLHRFTMSVATKESVTIRREAWTEWYTEQELPRVRKIMNKYCERAMFLPRTGDFTAAGLIREIVDGIKSRAYDGGEPLDGIEVGVFVLQRVG